MSSVPTTMTPCPTDDTLGALVQRVLAPDEAERVTSHLDACESCQQIVIAAVRGAAITPTTALAVGTPSLPPVLRGAPARVGAPRRIGRYEVRGLLGAGGMGQVYDAYDAELDRAIALKVLRPELSGVALAERLLRESRIMAKVVHPAVITVHDVGRDGDAVFIAMERIRGGTLAAHVASERPGWREIVALYERAGQGLAAAHAAGVVHRDFKPDNVLVEPGRVVVTDFGIARATAADDDAGQPASRADVQITAPGAAIGTPAYMAPEQLAGERVDARADVFAFAVSLWEALFGARPFAGNTVAEIRAAMRTAPRAPRGGGVPRRLVRALERGLAIDPAARWPDMTAFTLELAAVRTRRRRIQLAAGATGLVALGIAGALVLAHPATVDRCARGLEPIAPAYDAQRAAALRAVLAGDPEVQRVVIDKLDTATRSWRDTQLATCKNDREPIQAPTVSACLDARRIEIDGFVQDVIADGPRWAKQLGGLLGDSAKCAAPAPGLLTARVPEDPALRRKVTALRYRGFAIEAARDRADYQAAIADGDKLVADAAPVWPLIHAETLYLQGTNQSMGGDTEKSLTTFREAAAVAETAHHDYVAANVWIQLALSSTFDAGEPTRGLEYATYAEAALDRIARPPLVLAMFDYVKGATLVELQRPKDAEPLLREAVAVSEVSSPTTLPQAIQGLGYLYENEGRYEDAVTAFRSALAHLPPDDHGSSSAIIFRERLAIDLSLLGKATEADAVAREAVALADKVLGKDNLDGPVAHINLAQVLQNTGRPEEALAEAERAVGEARRIVGDRSERYAEALEGEADILLDLGRDAQADKLLGRACDIIAFAQDENAAAEGECWISQVTAEAELGRDAEALVLAEKVLAIFTQAYHAPHPELANALVARGALLARRGKVTEGIADLEGAIGQFEQLALEPGHLGAAQWELSRILWRRDPERAHALIATAIDHLRGPNWKKTLADATQWRDSDGHPKPKK